MTSVAPAVVSVRRNDSLNANGLGRDQSDRYASASALGVATQSQNQIEKDEMTPLMDEILENWLLDTRRKVSPSLSSRVDAVRRNFKLHVFLAALWNLSRVLCARV